MTEPLNPYATVKTWFDNAPGWLVDPDDKDRYLSYRTYEKIYDNYPETFKLTKRGEDSQDIYIPSAKKIIEATNRFLGVGLSWSIDPAIGSQSDRDNVSLALKNLFKREKFYSKMSSNKRWGLIRGDALWHITADPKKTQGTRISLHELHPGEYFPIYEDDNNDRIIGCHIVQLMPDPRDDKKSVIRRQTYRKVDNGITSELGAFEIDKWDDRNIDAKEVKQIAWPGTIPEFFLPKQINAIPIYHIRNDGRSSDPFGSSLIRGTESLIAAMNQSITDEDYTLVMQGLGFYSTNAAPPTDSEGVEQDWEIGPARVAEIGDDQFFNRVTGVSSVAPMLDHIRFLSQCMQEGTGVPDIAVGTVDVAVAESGISLALKMGPIIAANKEREIEILSTYDQMFYDIINQWLPAYENLTSGLRCSIDTIVEDAMPVNRSDIINELVTLITNNLITEKMAEDALTKLGYEFDSDALDQIVDRQKQLASANNYDPFQERVNREMDNANNPKKNNGVPVESSIGS